MYVIITYDVGIERVNKVRIFLKQYLNWVQNSVCEGELTKSEFVKVKLGLEKIIKKDYDSVFIYRVRDKLFIEFDELGTRKSFIDKII